MENTVKVTGIIALLKQSIVNRLVQLSSKWWLFYAASIGATLLIVVISSGTTAFLPEAPHIIYTYVYYRSNYWHLGELIFIGATIGSILFGIKKHSIWKGLLLFLLFIGVSLFLGEIYFTQLEPNDLFSTVRHVETEYSGEYAFNLLRHEGLGIDMPIVTYNLYQCDRLSISCDLLYQGQIPNGVVALGNDLRYPARIFVRDQYLLLSGVGDISYQHPLTPDTPR